MNNTEPDALDAIDRLLDRAINGGVLDDERHRGIMAALAGVVRAQRNVRRAVLALDHGKSTQEDYLAWRAACDAKDAAWMLLEYTAAEVMR